MAYVEALIAIENTSGNLSEAITRLVSYKPDLIIEGATGSRPTLRNLIQSRTNIPYIGLDLNWDIIQEHGFTRYGNCVRPDSVNPIIQEFAARQTAFVTWHALSAILSDRISPEDRKDSEDILSTEIITKNITQLFAFQMHVIYKGFFASLKPFFKYCVDLGWHLFSYDQGQELMAIVMTRDGS